MNSRKPYYSSSGPVAHHVEFNSTGEYFCVALDDGFSIHRADTSELHLREEMDGSVGFATMLGASQIVGLLYGGDRPRLDRHHLVLWDTARHAQAASIRATAPLVRARLSAGHIAAVLERRVCLYRHRAAIERVAEYDTAPNPLGLCCLGARTLVLPGRSPGQVQVVDLATLNVSIVPTHTSALRALELSPGEELVATASEKGTLIRLHSTASSARLSELRRGVTTANILSLAFSPESERLAVTSDTNTLHVFELLTGGGAAAGADPGQAPRSSPSPTPERRGSSSSHAAAGGNKWGGLSRLPFAPRVFTDVYSAASAAFDRGGDDDDETLVSGGDGGREDEGFVDVVAGVPGGVRARGKLAWVDAATLVVAGAGRDARFERFALSRDAARGRLVCARDGWSRFLVPG